MKWDFKKNILFKEGMVFKTFRKTIEKILFVENKIIILFESDSDLNNNNVSCVKNNGELKWVVDSKNYPNHLCPITNIYIVNDFLYVYRRCGIEEKIDLNNGKILESELIK